MAEIEEPIFVVSPFLYKVGTENGLIVDDKYFGMKVVISKPIDLFNQSNKEGS